MLLTRDSSFHCGTSCFSPQLEFLHAGLETQWNALQLLLALLVMIATDPVNNGLSFCQENVDIKES